ncbi:hypothetical protein RhiLY_08548 [Ceratobasidium sp. AG-Ba]|nr:hypothetical protein RhiLY_08548 [Ceratobasidium sp. AG-Ba]
MLATTNRPEFALATKSIFEQEPGLENPQETTSSPHRRWNHSTVEQDLENIRSWLSTEAPGSLEINCIAEAQFTELEDRINQEDLRLRYDWDPENQRLSLFMASPLHEVPGGWMGSLLEWLQRELRLVCRCGTPSLINGCSGIVEYPNGRRMAPDTGIFVQYAIQPEIGPEIRVIVPFPRVVLETAFSQSLEDARRKIHAHLHLSDEHTHVGILCNMKKPVTCEEDFWATIEVWTRDIDENNTDDQLPYEVIDFKHEQRKLEEGVEPVINSGEYSPSPTLAGSDPDVTLTAETDGVTWPESGDGKKMRRRWGPVVLIKEGAKTSRGVPADDPRPGDTLPLNVYDFLRVCREHDGPGMWMDPNELLLPLDSLKEKIMDMVLFNRESIRKKSQKTSAQPLPPPPPPSAPTKRGNPFKEMRSFKRSKE